MWVLVVVLELSGLTLFSVFPSNQVSYWFLDLNRPIRISRIDVAHILAIFENYVAEIRLDGKAVQLALWDTA